MPYQAVRSAFAGADEIALTMAIPRDHKPIRLPTFPNLERTAVLSTMQAATTAVTGASVARALLFRSPTYPVWVKQTTATAQFAGLVWNFTAQAADDATLAFTAPPESYFGTASNQHLVLGRKDDGLWLYVPAGCYVGLRLIVNTSATMALTLSYQVFDGTSTGTTETVASLTGTDVYLTASSAFTVGSWVRFISLDVNASASLSSYLVNLGWVTGGSFFSPTGTLSSIMPLGAPPEFNNSIIPYGSTRANAVAVLFSNVTAVLNKEGTVRATRVPMSTPMQLWGAFENDPAFAASHPAETYWGPLEKGLYAYTLPDEATVRFRDCTVEIRSDAGVKAYLPAFDLDGFQYASLIAFTDLTTGDSTLAVTVDSHLEFRTNSALFQLGFSATTLEAEHVAQMACVRKGVFFENPTHMTAIAALIRQGLTAVAPVLRSAAKGAMVYAGDRLLSAAKTKLANFAQANPGSSGQLPGKKSKTKKRGPVKVAKRNRKAK